MTSDEFGEVDIDLLADYIGGALDGPAAAEVARLIDQDPRWRETHDLLVLGMAAVGAELNGLAPEPMPADLASRLEASFASPIASPTTIDPVLAGSAEPHVLPSASRHLSSVAGTGGGDRPAGRRKRLRWAAPIAVAAGVLAFAGFGADYLAGQSGGSQDAASSAAGSAQNAAPMIAEGSGSMPGVISVPGDDRILSSGTDYDDTQLADRVSAAQKQQREARGYPSAPLGSADSGPPELQRLGVRDALLACLEAISRENNEGPIDVETVDFARYQGAPALMVRFLANGMSMAWAVGPDCGIDGGADRL